MHKLKRYQENTLEALQRFLERSRLTTIHEAFRESVAEQHRNDPYQDIFPDVPCVCLRVPTGGGKTLLSAHAVAIAGKAIKDSDSPVALWLTPSDTIRSQTIEALANPKHPYREALSHHFGDRVRVCDLESLQTIGTNDVGKSCVIVVTTIQSLNVSDTAKRNVYMFFEELAEHFRELPPHVTANLEKVSEADLAAQPFLTAKDVGRVKWSVANWLALQRPVVIVDEAHNNKTHRFFTTLSRMNPSCVIEMTATPVAGNNVLYHVSAQELRAEQMIKMPIVLAEHPTGWRDCLGDSIRTRNTLELAAQKEAEYLRPIVLIQAMPAGQEATTDVVKAHLINEENIPESQIVVVKSGQKGLDGVNLFDPACPVRYVITIEALKEGWDCSFAYVLSGLQSVKSSKDVEQLLGRVLRMPYARERSQESLNKAYAHIVESSFAEAASSLRDRLINNMGFERLDTSGLIVPQKPLFPPGTDDQSQTPPPPVVPDCFVELPAAPQTEHWPDELKSQVEIRPTSQGATLILKGNVDADMLRQAEAFVVASLPAKAKEKVTQQFADHRAMRQALRAPAQLGLSFAPIPQLCLMLDGELEVVEKSTLAYLSDWSPLDYPVQLAGFAIHETVNSFEIDMNGEKVRFKHVDAQQLHLNEMTSNITREDLVRWLDVELRQPFLSQQQMQAYLSKLLSHLAEKQFTLTQLVRARFQLTTAVRTELERLRRLAMQKGFQGRLFDMQTPKQENTATHSFTFDAGRYPARNLYQPGYEFSKHFYPVIHDLREKTGAGAISEEFRCAQAIDRHPKVKHWVRNIERQEQFSFWLPTSTDYFYPDFVAELTDGRVLVIEYKGLPYASNDDSREKILVGQQWEKTSNGRCLFLFALGQDDRGRDVYKQIDDKIEERP